MRNDGFELMQIRDKEKAYLFREANSALACYPRIKMQSCILSSAKKKEITCVLKKYLLLRTKQKNKKKYIRQQFSDLKISKQNVIINNYLSSVILSYLMSMLE